MLVLIGADNMPIEAVCNLSGNPEMEICPAGFRALDPNTAEAFGDDGSPGMKVPICWGSARPICLLRGASGSATNA